MSNDELVRMLSLRERKEAVEEQLKWIAIQQTAIDNIYANQKDQLAKQREAVLRAREEIFREEARGRKT